jgi:hypothetical protein
MRTKVRRRITALGDQLSYRVVFFAANKTTTGYRRITSDKKNKTNKKAPIPRLGNDASLKNLYRQLPGYKKNSKESRAALHKAAGRFLEWLGFAIPDDDADTGYSGTNYLCQLPRKESDKVLISSKVIWTYHDSDVIQSAFEGAFGQEELNPVTRQFLIKLLKILQLLKCARTDNPIPTRYLRKLVATCRQLDRDVKRSKNASDADKEQSIETKLTVAREEAYRIDPEIAEMGWDYRYISDPYAVLDERPDARVIPDMDEIRDMDEIPVEAKCLGREWFARSPKSEIWVWFGDLPGAVAEALMQRHARQMLIPALIRYAPGSVPRSLGKVACTF